MLTENNISRIMLSGFNGYPKYSCTLLRPEYYQDFIPRLPNCIARGQGLSYGDAAVNTTGVVISTARLNRFLAFDQEIGTLTVEAGVTLNDICRVVVSKGWLLPVMPGTAFVTVGGAVAADVHGKNHFREGSFSQHVIWFELMCADGNRIRCSVHENPHIFWATVGGMGLTGFITMVCLKLKRIFSPLMEVDTQATNNLEETLNVLQDKLLMYEYSVAWMDLQASVKRGIVMSAQHVTHVAETVDNVRTRSNPSHLTNHFLSRLPMSLVNSFSVTMFNQCYYAVHKRKTKPYYVNYQDYFYPLDKYKYWPLLYGKKAFIQYQCVFPMECAFFAIQKLFDLFRREKITCSLVVLKRFGLGNQSPLSFAREGITLAVDIPLAKNVLKSLEQADEWVLSQGGKVYLAKDARLSKAMFMKMYPEYLAWMKIKDQIDANNIFQSALSDRLLYGYEKN